MVFVISIYLYESFWLERYSWVWIILSTILIKFSGLMVCFLDSVLWHCHSRSQHAKRGLKVQARLCKCVISLEPSLSIQTVNGFRWSLRKRAEILLQWWGEHLHLGVKIEIYIKPSFLFCDVAHIMLYYGKHLVCHWFMQQWSVTMYSSSYIQKIL